MKTKIITFLCVIISLPLFAEVKILSTASWSPTITGSWTNNEGCQYSNTIWGDTYYNSGYQNFNSSQTIQSKDVYRYFYVGPDTKRNWTFTMPISNLNAKKGYSYYSKSAPNNKQQSDKIYWGISIGFKVNGSEKNVYFWLSRSPRKWDSYIGEHYDSEKYIYYCVGSGGWNNSYKDYPSCEQGSSPSLKIQTYSSGSTYIYWGDLQITSFSSYAEQITYIYVMIGTQADIQIGKPSAYGSGVNANNIYDASDLIQQENYLAAKNKLYRADNAYYEKPACNLAFCYLALGEFDKSIEICNALIKYSGEGVSFAYMIRGYAKEEKGQKLDALDDYQKAGATEEYNRLYNEIYKPKQQQQTKPRQQATQPSKPALTK